MTSMTLPSPRLSHHWRLPLMSVVVMILLVLLTYHGTAVAMVGIWIRSETFTHAFVVPPIVLWLIWRKRAEIEPMQPRPMPWMVVPMTGLALMWWLGQLVNVAAAMQFAMVAMIVLSVPLVLGWQVTRALSFPLAFLFFAVPFGEFLTPTLMHWTAEVLVFCLRLTGLPVYQEGQHLVIPSGRWAVVDACSGFRYLMATFMVGSLFAYLNYQSSRRRLIFVAVSLVLPVIANWVRAYIIVMLGHLSNNEIATGADHLVYGWVFFGIVIMGLFYIGARWSEPEDERAGEVARAARALEATYTPGWRSVAIAGVALLMLQWPLWFTGARDLEADQRAPVNLTLPATLGTWRGDSAPTPPWKPHFIGARSEQVRGYRGADGTVTVYVAYYRGQGDDAKLVSSTNLLLKKGIHDWHVSANGRAQASAGSESITWRTATLLAVPPDGVNYPTSSQQPRLSVWRVYWIGGHVTHSDIKAKLLQAWLAVRGEPDDAAAIHLVSTLPDEEAAKRQLTAFVSENFHMLQQTLAATRQSR